MSADDRLPWRDAIRFWWHCVAHRAHAQDVWFDVRADTVRCGACGRSWPEKGSPA